VSAPTFDPEPPCTPDEQESGPCAPVYDTILAMPGDLYYGDNLEILRRHFAPKSVDLIYLDPPFNSDETYGLLHKGSQAQQDAFWDSWHWDDAARDAFAALTNGGHGVPRELSDMMVALKAYLYPKHQVMLAYLSMMGIRLVEMKRVLRDTGSLYLHCDPTASHYLKLILDMIFGAGNFRSEVIWKRSSAHNACRFHSPVHDVIFFYTKSDEYTWNPVVERLPQKTLDEWYNNVEEGTGRRFNRADLTGSGVRNGDSGAEWRGVNPTAKGRHWAIPRSVEIVKEIAGDLPTLEALDALDDAGRIFWPDKEGGVPMFKRYVEEAVGVPALDVITSIRHLHNKSTERTGYGTQKPKPLLTHLIELSSNVGDTVLDPFCGCGTTIEAAEETGRKWYGIDIAIRAVDVMKERLDAKFNRRIWTEHGEPKDIEQAERLAKNEYDFQWWAVRMLGGSPPKGEKKKGADDGVDGELRLIDDAGTVRRGLISVKAGHVLVPDFVKTLHDNVREKKYDFGILATMHEPTQGMRDRAANYEPLTWATAYKGKLSHRIRIVMAAEWLPPNEVRWPGKIERPHSQSVPPPPEVRAGETFHLPFAVRTPKTKQRRGPGTAKTHEVERAPERVVAERGSARPKSK
jgi:DNA modification methylase